MQLGSDQSRKAYYYNRALVYPRSDQEWETKFTGRKSPVEDAEQNGASTSFDIQGVSDPFSTLCGGVWGEDGDGDDAGEPVASIRFGERVAVAQRETGEQVGRGVVAQCAASEQAGAMADGVSSAEPRAGGGRRRCDGMTVARSRRRSP
jgi:hypothetical protein